jgi:hypothetical protein
MLIRNTKKLKVKIFNIFGIIIIIPLSTVTNVNLEKYQIFKIIFQTMLHLQAFK